MISMGYTTVLRAVIGGYVRIILVVMAPSVSVLKFAFIAKLGNWNTKVFAGT
jgi:hypothetical protein